MKNTTSPYYDIVLTDIQLHVQKPRNPDPFWRKMAKFFRTGNTERVFDGKIIKTKNEQNRFTMDFTSGLDEAIKIAQGQGKKFIRIFAPKNAVPICAGKDVMEFLEARKRINKIKK